MVFSTVTVVSKVLKIDNVLLVKKLKKKFMLVVDKKKCYNGEIIFLTVEWVK